MASQSIWSKYTKLLRGNGDGPPETFSNVIEVTDLQCPTMTNELIDVSNFDSVGAFKDKLVTFIEPGAMKATVNYIAGNATQKALIADQGSQVNRQFKVEFRNAAGTLLDTMLFGGYVSFGIGVSMRAQRTATLTVDVTGPVSFL